MSKCWEKIKEHPIANKVVAGLILLILTKLFDVVFSLNIFSSIINFANQKYTVSLWGLIVIFIILILLVVGIIFIIDFFQDDKQQIQEWRIYTEDTVFEVLCQWRYIGNSIDVDSLIILCPTCKRQLERIEDYSYCTGYYLKCIKCDFKTKKFNEINTNFRDKIIFEIEGRIRNGEYKDKIKKVL